MTFDPTKPCATRGSKYPVTILTVLPRPDVYGYTIYGTYTNDDDAINVEGWYPNGAYGPGSVLGGSLDLINVPPPPKYIVSGRCVVRVIAGVPDEIVATNPSHTDLDLICAALNAYGR